MSNSEAKEDKATQWIRPTVGSPCWISIPAAEVSRARAFYDAIFLWKFRDPNPGYAADKLIAFTIPGSSVMGGIVKDDNVVEGGDKMERNGVIVYLLVDDVDDTLGNVKAAGGSIVSEKIREGNHTERATFKDTEGNLVGILKWLF